MKITIIGSGIGGLASAALLAAEGHTVDVFEQNDHIGGKAGEFNQNGFRFDTGPSVFTMPFILNQVFNLCRKQTADYVNLIDVDPLCRYRFHDGVVFDHGRDDQKNKEALHRIAPEDIESWDNFARYAKTLYDRAADPFLFSPLESMADIPIKKIMDVLRIDMFSTVSHRVDSFFTSQRMRQFYKRYATYNGSSPYLAPATFNVIAHVEQQLGGYYIKGGMYQLVEALSRLATECGARIHTGVHVEKIDVNSSKKGRVTGTTIHGAHYDADIVVANSDAIPTYLNMLQVNSLSSFKRKRLERIEPSCSGFVVLLGIDRMYEELEHHNIFFSRDYEAEFTSIFEKKELPEDPTIYVANTSKTDPDDAPKGGSNLFMLVNAPYTTDTQTWHEWRGTYSDHIIHTLESRGLPGLANAIVLKHVITPSDFQRIYGAHRGSIYGISSNKLSSAFMRPKNKSPLFNNLYLCGGSTHPGGGIPLVLQSALNVHAMITRDYS